MWRWLLGCWTGLSLLAAGTAAGETPGTTRQMLLHAAERDMLPAPRLPRLGRDALPGVPAGRFLEAAPAVGKVPKAPKGHRLEAKRPARRTPARPATPPPRPGRGFFKRWLERVFEGLRRGLGHAGQHKGPGNHAIPPGQGKGKAKGKGK